MRNQPRRPAPVRQAQRTGGLTGPHQIGSVCIRHCCETPGLRSVGVVAVGMDRQVHRLATVLPHPRRDAKDELAGTARQHDAPRFNTMELRQHGAQCGVTGVGITRGVRLLHRLQRLRAGSTGIAVGGEVVTRRPHCVRPAVGAQWRAHGEIPLLKNATKIIAVCAHTTRASSAFDAKRRANAVCAALAGLPCGLST